MAEIRVLVTGGRDYTDRDTVTRYLRHLNDLYIHGVAPEQIVLVHGDCRRKKPDGSFDPDRSADQLAKQEAEKLGWRTEPHPVDWPTIPRSKWSEAGRGRNKHMVDLGANYCVAFPGGSGTAHCRRLAKSARIFVIDVKETARV